MNARARAFPRLGSMLRRAVPLVVATAVLATPLVAVAQDPEPIDPGTTTSVVAPPESSTDPSTTVVVDSSTSSTAAPDSSTSAPEESTTVAPESSTSSTAAPAEPTTTVVAEALDAPITPMAEPGDPVGTAYVSKVHEAPASEVRPGQSFYFQIVVGCDGGAEGLDCPGLVLEDTIPSGLLVDCGSLPPDNSSWDFSCDPGTGTITATARETTSNPSGLGLNSGNLQTIPVRVTLPVTTTLEPPHSFVNTASVSQENVTVPTSASAGPVSLVIDRALGASANKQWTPSAGIATTDAESTIRLTSANQSSSVTDVTELVINDAVPAVWNAFDLANAELVQLPTGATSAHLEVCDLAAVCVAGAASAAAGPLALPVTLPSSIGNVRVVFTGALANTGSPGIVELDVVLRDTYRDGSGPINPTTSTPIANVVTTTVSDDEGSGSGSTSNATYVIQPSTLSITSAKQFFGDANGNFVAEAGEAAVLRLPSRLKYRPPTPRHLQWIRSPSSTTMPPATSSPSST